MRGARRSIPRSRRRRPVLGAVSALFLLLSAVAAAFPAARPCSDRPDCLCCASRETCTCPPDAACGCNESLNDRPPASAVPSAGLGAPFAAPPPSLGAPPAPLVTRAARFLPVSPPFLAPDTPPPEA